MFREILRVIIADGLIDRAHLARKTGVDVEIVEDMIRLLIDRGYLSEHRSSDLSHSGCIGCPLSSKCGSGNSIMRTYSISPKGKRYAEA